MNRRSSTIYFTADLHFGHKNILKFEKREFCNALTVEEHDEALITLYNSVVGPDDVCYILGDVCFNKSPAMREKLRRLNGRKILIRGNHDSGFSDTFYYDSGFAAVVEEAIISIGKTKLRLSHYPYYPTWWTIKLMDWGFRKKIRYLEKRPKNDGKWLLHGHIHSAAKNIPWRNQIHIGLDSWGGKPVSSDKIIDLMGTQKVINYMKHRPIIYKIVDRLRSYIWRSKNFVRSVTTK